MNQPSVSSAHAADPLSLGMGSPVGPAGNTTGDGAGLDAHSGPEVGTERAVCDFCGADDHELLFRSGDRRHPVPGTFAVVRCRQCDLVYLSPRPDAASLPRYYPEDYSPYGQRPGLARRLTTFLRKREAAGMRRWLPPGAKILEVGCAAGDLLAPLRDEGFDVTGVEMSAYAATIARERHGLVVHTGTLADVPPNDGAYDAVVMRSVIEHLPSPTADLKIAARLLKRGGYLFVTTDNFASTDREVFGEHWYGFDVPRHFNLFTPHTLERLLQSAGLAVKQVRYSLVPNHWIVSARYALERRVGKRRALSAMLSLHNPVLLGALLPVTVVQRALQCGGRMSVIATKLMALVTVAA